MGDPLEDCPAKSAQQNAKSGSPLRHYCTERLISLFTIYHRQHLLPCGISLATQFHTSHSSLRLKQSYPVFVSPRRLLTCAVPHLKYICFTSSFSQKSSLLVSSLDRKLSPHISEKQWRRWRTRIRRIIVKRPHRWRRPNISESSGRRSCLLVLI